MTEISIPTFSEFINDFPAKFMSDENVAARLRFFYNRAVNDMKDRAAKLEKDGKDYAMFLATMPGESSCSQYIAYFCLQDLTKKYDPNNSNYGGYNESRLVMNGGIMFDERLFNEGNETCVRMNT